MSLPEDIASLSREELLALVAEQQRQIAGLRAQLEEATTVVEKLRVEVTELQRSSKRQATPFNAPAVGLGRALSLSARNQVRKKSLTPQLMCRSPWRPALAVGAG